MDRELPEGFVLNDLILSDKTEWSPQTARLILGKSTRPGLTAPPTARTEDLPSSSTNETTAASSGEGESVKPTQIVVKAILEFAEHYLLADTITLPGPAGFEGLNKKAKDIKLLLENGASLTYGTINALAGDFFSTATPITTSDNPAEQQAQFMKAYKTLSTGSTDRINALLNVLSVEVKKVDQAIQKHQDVHKVYEELGDRLAALENASEKDNPPKGEDYTSLLATNRDHFYPDHRAAYNAGHTLAIQTASSGKVDDLIKAYTINAFADHYLGDAFASGHLRVPRVKMMTTNIFTNILANFMHNEDNINGLWVHTGDNSDPSNPSRKWKNYGDSMMFTDAGKQTYQMLARAVTASIQEVWEAFETTSAQVDPAKFKAWRYCASADKIFTRENYCPMFTISDEDGAILQRKGLDKNPTATPSSEWEFERVWDSNSPGAWVLASWSPEKMDYIYFGRLAYLCAPTGKIKDTIRQEIKLRLLNSGWSESWADWLLSKLGL